MGKKLVKVKNVGDVEYVSGFHSIAPGQVEEVSEERAEYLCSEESPGKFEVVNEKDAK